MTTDKIRAAAQKLLDAIDSKYIDEINAEITDLRAALAEPAQAAPADDAVPVVAYEWTEEGFAGSPLKQWHDCPPGYVTSSRPLIYQRDHLAAMEALRAERDNYLAMVDSLIERMVPGDVCLATDEFDRIYSQHKARLGASAKPMDVWAAASREFKAKLAGGA